MTSPVVDLSTPQRQSPLAAVFLVIKAIRAIGVVQIAIGVGFVISQSRSIALIAIGALIIALILLVLSLLSWWRYTFFLQDGELRVESGVLSRNRLTLPLDRVQSVSIEQKFLHRIVGLVEVTADTAGTALSEFNLSAVNRPVAEAIQTAAADHRVLVGTAPPLGDAPVTSGLADGEYGPAIPPPPAQPERVLIKRSPMALIKIALTTVPIYALAVLAPLFAVGGDLIDNLPFDLPEITVEVGSWLFWFVPLALFLVAVFGMLLNIVAVLLREWDLTITQTAAGLRRNAGLLSKTSTASSIPRIQSLSETQNVLERWVGIRSMRLEGVSSVSLSGTGSAGGTIAIDGCTPDEVEMLREIVFDGDEPVAVLDQTVSHLEIYKQTRNTTVAVLLLILGLFWSPIGAWALLFALIVPLTWWSTRRSTLRRRWGINAQAIADRHEFFGYRSTETLLRKTNSATVRQSLFERKRDLATVSLKLANGQVSIGMIPLAQAQAIRDQAIYVAETDTRAFM